MFEGGDSATEFQAETREYMEVFDRRKVMRGSICELRKFALERRDVCVRLVRNVMGLSE